MPDNTTKQKTVLVTGATGYIGRRLTQRLLETSPVAIRLLVRNKNKVQATIADKTDIREG